MVSWGRVPPKLNAGYWASELPGTRQLTRLARFFPGSALHCSELVVLAGNCQHCVHLSSSTDVFGQPWLSVYVFHLEHLTQESPQLDCLEAYSMLEHPQIAQDTHILALSTHSQLVQSCGIELVS